MNNKVKEVYNQMFYSNYNNHDNFASKSLFEVIDRGINLMSTNVDNNLLQAWQDYAMSVLNMISNRYGLSVYSYYLQFRLSITHLTPYEQLKLSIQELLNISKSLPRGI